MQILLVMLPHFSLIPFYKWRDGMEHTSGKLLTSPADAGASEKGVSRET